MESTTENTIETVENFPAPGAPSDAFVGKGETQEQRVNRINKQLKIVSATLGNLDGRLCALEKFVVNAVNFQATFTNVIATLHEIEMRVKAIEDSKTAAERFDLTAEVARPAGAPPSDV